MAGRADYPNGGAPEERGHSPGKGRGGIIAENERKLRAAVQENEALQQLYEKKQLEQQKVDYKY